MDNHPTIHTNRFGDGKSEVETARDRMVRISQNTFHFSTLDKMPKEAMYVAFTQESIRYDSGYGDHGSPDMCTTNYVSMVGFGTEEALEAFVLTQADRKNSYKVFYLKPVETEVKAIFSIKDVK